ncbi:MAG: tetraacyldisaccharide 4'-kinase [bacterium]|nr:tetraacyldisaccharide 4'-kinase [bacterium]
MSVFVKAPKWWQLSRHPLSYLLVPLGMVYGLAVKLRFALIKPYHSTLPVICIGNFTVGGGGKTPLAIAVAKLLSEAGYKPVILTRGYGGQTQGPHLVDHSVDSAVGVGDEPLILAQFAPVVVCADRARGARFIEQMEADVILMDDGFQNPTLSKDLSLIVLDAMAGVGNGRIFPAGPLRAALAFQMPQTDILVLSGPPPVGTTGSATAIEKAFARQIFHSDIVAKGDNRWLKGATISVVTGIARPDKFYGSLQALGAVIVEMYEFPDHHSFSEQEAKDILIATQIDETQIIMTQKDWVRLPANGERGRLRKVAKFLEVEVKIDHPDRLLEQLQKTISAVTRYSA